ncbi:MAG: nucleotide-binding universal stress UspA family protein [Saprospiraceae bacterium]|jgi:nucleotide-binding universal stress UspA family protein
MKKKIIVPVDFSATSQNAYLYARELAKHYGAGIEVLHVYMGTFSPDESGTRPSKTTKASLQEQLDDFVSLYPSSRDSNVLTDVEVSTKIIQGFTVKSIVDLSIDESTSMIVMGSTGKSEIVDRIIGRISSEVAQQAFCPVLMVPKGAKFFSYKNILYASNYESADEFMLEQILNFNKTFSATLHFIHVSTKSKSKRFDITEEQIFDTLFKEGEPIFSFNLALEKAGSVMKGLFKYAEKNKIDLIVLVNRQRGFVESALGQSMTKKMALRSQTPLLIYHIPE